MNGGSYALRNHEKNRLNFIFQPNEIHKTVPLVRPKHVSLRAIQGYESLAGKFGAPGDQRQLFEVP
jgi:hypothetical protein